MDTERRAVDHLESGEVAAFLDGALPPSDRARVIEHLADCQPCRAEVVEVARLLRSRPRPGRWYLPLGVAAAAAAVALLVLWPRPPEQPAGPGNYREPPVTTTVAPVVIAPKGMSPSPRELVWSGVPHAERYRLTVFDDTGRVLWETQAGDTAVQLPESIRLHPGQPYFWKVEAQTGWNRWVSSDLVEFTLGPPP
jgi:anti-sigma factor RsiW